MLNILSLNCITEQSRLNCFKSRCVRKISRKLLFWEMLFQIFAGCVVETGEVMDQSITNVVDINPIQILLTSLLEFKLERRSRNISSILKGYVMASEPIAPFPGLPRYLLFQRKKDFNVSPLTCLRIRPRLGGEA